MANGMETGSAEEIFHRLTTERQRADRPVTGRDEEIRGSLAS
jgi:hypothetical protein